jgi:hypothetical protein
MNIPAPNPNLLASESIPTERPLRGQQIETLFEKIAPIPNKWKPVFGHEGFGY